MWVCMLDFCTISLFDMLVWLILRYNRWGMLEPLQCLLKVCWHQKVHLLVGIVPFDGKSAAISFPFLFKQARIVFLHRLSQVLSVFVPNLFYPKVVGNVRKVIGRQSWVHSPGVVLLWLYPFSLSLFLPQAPGQ